MNLAQTTLQASINLDGTGLFSGKEVKIEIHPSTVNSGIHFVRTDLQGEPTVEANCDFTELTPLNCTVLKNQRASVQTVEHLLAALYACDIDNATIKVNSSEIPIFDGSSKLFVEMIQEVGVKNLESEKKTYVVNQPIYYEDGETTLVALPSTDFRISYSWYCPHSSFYRSQYFSDKINKTKFIEEICFCRTFAFYEDIAPLIKQNKVKGASLEQGILIRKDRVVNEMGLRIKNELVNHKVLDLIGDLALVGGRIQAHVIAMRSGHKSNIQLAKKIKKFANLRSICTN